MIRRVAKALWTRSPADLTAAMATRFRRDESPAGPASLSPYHLWLLDEVYAFVKEEFPEDALSRDAFMALMTKHLDSARLRVSNRYLGDLWYLFAPDFQRRLDEYYRYQDYQLTMTLLSYAANAPLLQSNYLRPYDIAVSRLNRFSVLELGAGIPHGFLHTVYRSGPSFCTGLTTVDIDGTPARFVRAFCVRHAIPHHWIRATAGLASQLGDTGPSDFVFAKDVFEHLTNPAASLNDLLAHVSGRGVLALDLDDKGAAVYQHVSPVLEPFKAHVTASGLVPFEHTGNMSMFACKP